MRFWLVLTGALIFAAGGAVGFAGGRCCRGPETPVPLTEAFVNAPAFLVSGPKVYEELALNEDQRRRIDELVKEHFQEVRGIRSSMGQVVAALYAGVEEILTEEQRERFHGIQRRYNAREIQFQVEHEVMSYNLDLSPAQEVKVYRILFDTALERREAWRSCRDKGSHAVRPIMEEISARRDGLLQEVFTMEQWEAYRKLKDRQRKGSNERRKDGAR